MAREKNETRKSTGGASWPWCFRRNLMEKYPPSKREEPSRRDRNAGQDILSPVTENCKSLKEFTFFSKLPLEIRLRIWAMATEDGRVVAVHSVTGDGLRSRVPPILHVCSESREAGLKEYALSFSAPSCHRSEDAIPPRVYFNFDRDILYFRGDWNERVTGAWSCLSQLRKLINKEDLQRVRAIGIDINANVCSSRSYSDHGPNFMGWTGLKTLYLGLEKPLLDPDGEVEFHQLQSKDYSVFMREYRRSSCWPVVSELSNDAAAVEYLKIKSIRDFCICNRCPGIFCEGLRLVNVVGFKTPIEDDY